MRSALRIFKKFVRIPQQLIVGLQCQYTAACKTAVSQWEEGAHNHAITPRDRLQVQRKSSLDHLNSRRANQNTQFPAGYFYQYRLSLRKGART